MKKGDLNILRGELIGLKVCVDNHIEGIVIDETKNLFVIKTNGKAKKFVKKKHQFKFILPDKHITVEGKTLALKPEDRIKLRI